MRCGIGTGCGEVKTNARGCLERMGSVHCITQCQQEPIGGGVQDQSHLSKRRSDRGRPYVTAVVSWLTAPSIPRIGISHATITLGLYLR
jgi:hypothetical protein